MDMKSSNIKIRRRLRRKRGIRKGVYGTPDKPRLTVFRSHKHIYAQIIDDEKGVTICSAGSRNKDIRDKISYGGNIAAAKIVGTTLAELAKAKKIKSVCFDRNGYRFHGRVKGLADALREEGIKF